MQMYYIGPSGAYFYWKACPSIPITSIQLSSFCTLFMPSMLKFSVNNIIFFLHSNTVFHLFLGLHPTKKRALLLLGNEFWPTFLSMQSFLEFFFLQCIPSKWVSIEISYQVLLSNNLFSQVYLFCKTLTIANYFRFFWGNGQSILESYCEFHGLFAMLIIVVNNYIFSEIISILNPFCFFKIVHIMESEEIIMQNRI